MLCPPVICVVDNDCAMDISQLDHSSFLQRNRIDAERWAKANITWDALRSIGEDFQRRASSLEDTAAIHARALQRCSAVHSVRWRLKDPEHLLEKIVRKRADQAPKYAEIDKANYMSIVTDLIGLRALHLFKEDWQQVHLFLADWKHHEEATAYVREGDSEQVRAAYANAGCNVRVHSAGYRSVHYVISSRPQKDEILEEVQVRTIFEEGWSEIDHRVRYPNFSEDPLVGLFLATFNRIAGSADEMGSFVVALATEIRRMEADQRESRTLTEQHLTEIEQLVEVLNKEKQKTASQAAQLEQLSKEISALRALGISQPGAFRPPGQLALSWPPKFPRVVGRLEIGGSNGGTITLAEFERAAKIFRSLAPATASQVGVLSPPKSGAITPQPALKSPPLPAADPPLKPPQAPASLQAPAAPAAKRAALKISKSPAGSVKSAPASKGATPTAIRPPQKKNG